MTQPNDRYARHGDLILVLNCGSSSIKFALFDAGQSPLPRVPVWNGKVQGIGGPMPSYGETGMIPTELTLDRENPYRAALQRIEQGVLARLDGRKLCGVAHRVVHGGSKYFASVRADEAVLADLKTYIPLAPLHQPFALEAIEAFLILHPALPQVACFDTAFHHSLPRVEQLLPLPYVAWERGMRRYGFHGLSYEYLSVALPERHGERARGRTIVAHLGSGASLCAMRDLQSVATTMGFSALDGLMMGTRTGALDPGAVLYLMEIEKLTLEQVGQVLYQQSGLLGVSGHSSEPRVLLPLETEDSEIGARARDALALYVNRIVREIGALIAVLGGLDLLVFTAGVGEHSAEIRRRVCTAFEFLGARVDAAANAADAPVISAPGSAIVIGVEPTNEEWIAARQAQALLIR
ncbi:MULTISPECIES: acetate/propionate family kinase [Pseudomonas]|uniref:Acetate kinase n=1 Tax=Pseudomonas helleri TaxID=1608996 RepID=A0A6L5HST8_9PSED|nr:MULTISPECIES: acetate/propionate family kinase [Pseudomonas]MQT47881.1 acetate/propionate family kinase [Pseudomonas helleri]MQT59184.1 acetate/propionate family kinase [Pseudomonas sp. FSL R10-0399]MQT88750.1 acetate/propionate family kinase [Pseudomonas helleri]MQU06436.1 acetate/propionate family kinase [Pseudomonas helleri]